MAEIILIRPQYSTILGKGKGGTECRPPAGLLYLAAPLVKNGFDVYILDQGKEPGWKEILKREIGEKTICIGITCLTGYMILNGLGTAEYIRTFNSNCPIVWGGVHPSLEPETTINSKFVDYIVIGEGEETFLELATCLREEGGVKNIRGIVYKESERIISTPRRPEYDLGSLPEIPFHLINFDHYKGHPSLREFFRFNSDTAVSIETSRGCTHRCSYCVLSSKTFSRHSNWRGMNSKKIADVIEGVFLKTGIKAFAIIEDNFFVDMERANKFLDELERRALSIEWFADARMDTILNEMDHRFLIRMQKLGLRSLGIGIESGSNAILKKIGKGETREIYLRANKKLAKYDIVPRYGLIVGFPEESPEDLVWTYDLVLQMMLDNPKSAIVLNKLIPNPQTPVFEECAKSGFPKPASLREWAYFSDTSWGQRKKEAWIREDSFRLIMNFFFIHKILRHSAASGKVTRFFRKISQFILKDLNYRMENRFFGILWEGRIFEFLERFLSPN